MSADPLQLEPAAPDTAEERALHRCRNALRQIRTISRDIADNLALIKQGGDAVDRAEETQRANAADLVALAEKIAAVFGDSRAEPAAAPKKASAASSKS